ncbi:MAG TPA: hypothetical protein VG458_09280 [Solirubrobacterales bacterium]|nr:hypothetical protein [Solirubrobacterales bacterium]
MRGITERRAIRVVFCLALVAACTAFLAACGSDDEGSQALTFEYTGEGEEAAFTLPEEAETGEVEITLVNEADGPADLQLIRVEGQHSSEEVVDAFNEVGGGKPFPDWFFAGGGLGTTESGEEATVTQVLEPGTYYALNTEGPVDPKTVEGIEVSGDEPDASLEADATIAAHEYGFETDGIVAGENELVFENTGAQPHHVIALKMVGDSTIGDVETFFKTERSKPPVEEGPSVGTAVIEGGEDQLAEFDLEPGRYALVCFITDRQGGPPHVFKGMIEELDVK